MRHDIIRKRCVCAILAAGLLATSACGQSAAKAPNDNTDTTEQTADATDKSGQTKDADSDTAPAGNTASDEKEVVSLNAGSYDFARPLLITRNEESEESSVTPSVPEYTVAADLSNVANADRFYLQKDWIKHLAQDGFFVQDSSGGEFFEIYEWNRYSMTPNFITVDSLMHSYHLFFSYIMKQTEKGELYDRLVSLTDNMLELCKNQKLEMMACDTMDDYTNAIGKAADRNIAFFAVAKVLLEPGTDPAPLCDVCDSEVLGVVKDELARINAEAGIDLSPLMDGTGEMEDYTQYKPRGYYDTDETLRRYFRAMMWYGRRNFTQTHETLDMSAMLMALAMDEKAYEDWVTIYSVTSFFAGESDDNGICEYRALAGEAFGTDPGKITGLMIASNQNAWKSFHEMSAKLDPPAINSVPTWDDGGATDKVATNAGFRFMGQRFSLDAAIFQKLIYSNVEENSQGDVRLLPDALDVTAALGSDTALKILNGDLGAGDYKNYNENMEQLRNDIKNAPAKSWYASLYAGWLDTLRPLLKEKGKGYPFFMQNENWQKKNLESFLGSYTELKHDTVLYSKQVIAEMGGGDDEEIVDDRGYVEPEPEVFGRFYTLAVDTMNGLSDLGILDGGIKMDLIKLSGIAEKLKTISEKELRGELPSDDEFEFIRCYGGEIEHFWQEACRDDADSEWFTSEEFPAAVVVDIATDPNGSVLEVATDNPASITVVVPVDGKLLLARGSVYSFYEFANPLDDRMTDTEWRVLMGISPDENGEFHWEREGVPDKPEWTTSYRVKYNYDE